jgi:glycosyltransferase involved in cell wall biosynthesis
MTPSRTLHVILYSAFPSSSGGRENWVYHLALAIRGAFSRIIVYSFADDAPPYFFFPVDGLEIVRVTSLQQTVQWRPTLASRLVHKAATLLDLLVVFPSRVARELAGRSRSGDVVLAMNSVTEMRAAARARGSRGILLLCSVRGHVSEELAALARVPGAAPFFRLLERQGLRAADRVLSNGDDTQAYLAERGYPSRVVPNGVDTRRFATGRVDDAPEVLRRLRADGVLITCVLGSLRRIKGTNEVIRAIPEFRRRFTHPAMFVFVGNGDPASFQALANQLGVGDAVLFPGELGGVEHCLAAADQVACVSYGSGMSMAALECMAAGKPIVAWDSAVYRQILTDGVTARLVPEGDAVALGAALADTAMNSLESLRMGKKAAESAWQYDWSAVGERFLAEVQSALAERA